MKISTKRKIADGIRKALMYFAAGLILALLVFLIGYILVRGIPYITLTFLTTKPSLVNETIGILPNLLNTLYIVFMTLIVVLPIGIGAAVYLNEYAKNQKLVRTIELATETLAGIPSIIYGLVGMLVFVRLFSLGTSLAAGAMTLAIMTLPTVIRQHNIQQHQIRNLYFKRFPERARTGKIPYLVPLSGKCIAY